MVGNAAGQKRKRTDSSSSSASAPSPSPARNFFAAAASVAHASSSQRIQLLSSIKDTSGSTKIRAAAARLETLDWSPLLTKYSAVLVESFARFLLIKFELEDVNARLLSPTPEEDQVWHDAILDTRFYQSLMLVIGQGDQSYFIHHDPRGADASQTAARAARRAATDAFRQLYFTSASNEPISTTTTTTDEVHIPAEEAKDPSTSSNNQGQEEEFPIWIRAAIDDVPRQYHVSRSATASDLKKMIQQHRRGCSDRYRLLFNGRQLFDEDTLASRGVGRDATVHLFHTLKGC